MKLESLSSVAADFPTLEVEYEDLLQYRFVRDARGENGTIDCLGILLEIYRRAGLGMPDLQRSSDAVLNFHKLFYEIETADTLYDVIHRQSGGLDHMWVVVRPGQALSTRLIGGPCLHKVEAVERKEGAKSYRVRPECLP